MSDTDLAKAGLARIAANFPGWEQALHTLARSDPALFELCEEYELASASLARFLVRADSIDCREVSEYRLLLKELELEIAELMRRTN